MCPGGEGRPVVQLSDDRVRLTIDVDVGSSRYAVAGVDPGVRSSSWAGWS